MSMHWEKVRVRSDGKHLEDDGRVAERGDIGLNWRLPGEMEKTNKT